MKSSVSNRLRHNLPLLRQVLSSVRTGLRRCGREVLSRGIKSLFVRCCFGALLGICVAFLFSFLWPRKPSHPGTGTESTQTYARGLQNAAFTMLLGPFRVASASAALERLYTYHLAEFPYPVLLFVPDDVVTDEVTSLKFKLHSSKVYPLVRPVSGMPGAYSSTLWCGVSASENLVQAFEYLARLDTDTWLQSVIPYDLFLFMDMWGISYGFAGEQDEPAVVTAGLWAFAKAHSTSYDTFANESGVFSTPTASLGGGITGCFPTSFEVLRVESFTKNGLLRQFNHEVMKADSVLTQHWCDASLRWFQVHLALPKNASYHFRDWQYSHPMNQSWVVDWEHKTCYCCECQTRK